MAKKESDAAKGKAVPAAAAGVDQKKTAASNIAGLEVVSKRDGFRRAGLVWRREPTVVKLADLSKGQIAMLRNDPDLVVVDVPLDGEAEGQA